jgi:NTP pyrophosphatase (non-canonical NTP hydrolase)
MDFKEYQEKANATSGAYGSGQNERHQILAALALAGEVGELCNKIKKKIAHRHNIIDAEIAEELGDILWYIAELCDAFGLSMEQVSIGNIAKLWERYGGKFSVDKSVDRCS